MDRAANISPEIKATVITLWDRAAECFGYKWAAEKGEPGGSVFQTWCIGLRDKTPADIKRGGMKLMQWEDKWLPDLPTFRRMCGVSAEDKGLPNVDAAWSEVNRHSHEVEQHRWSSSIVKRAATLTGWYEIRAASSQKALNAMREKYAEEYQRLVDSYGTGDDSDVLRLTDFNQESAAEKQERYGQQKAQEAVEAAGLPNKMSGSQALRMMRAEMKQTPEGKRKRAGIKPSDIPEEEKAQALADCEERKQERESAVIDQMCGDKDGE